MKALLHAFIWLYRHKKGRYAVDEFSAIRLFLGPGAICIDIGAHAGSWTLPLADNDKKSKVYAFEALPAYAGALRWLMRITGRTNVEIFNNAVSDNNNDVKIAWRTSAGKKLTGNTHLTTPAENTAVESVTVKAVTLDQWCNALPIPLKLQFIKIDVEGAELFVLRGATEIIRSVRPIIFLEIVASCCERYGYKPSDLFNLFASWNYRPFLVRGESSAVFLKAVSAQSYPEKGDVLLVPAETLMPEGLRVEKEG